MLVGGGSLSVVAAGAARQQQQQEQQQQHRHRQGTPSQIVMSYEDDVGPRDRFWRRHAAEQSLVYDGEDYYWTIQECLETQLSDRDFADLERQRAQPQLGMILYEDDLEEGDGDNDNDRRPLQQRVDESGQAYMVVVKRAILPVQVKAIRALARCARTYLPHLYESRAMYQELNLEEDPGLGGNCPTHLAPLVGIFLPDVAAEMQRTLEFAYGHAGWHAVVETERRRGYPRQHALPAPDEVGFRASEHLSYRDFPSLAKHTDGGCTAYTMNYAFTDDYVGGEFYVVDHSGGQRHRFKPDRYDALVFLGGRYEHGVDEIVEGEREMFSSELWAYPDTPFGRTLWTSVAENMEQYIRQCNDEQWSEDDEEYDYDAPCSVPFPEKTGYDMEMGDVRRKYGENDLEGGEDEPEVDLHPSRPNRIRPQPLEPVLKFVDGSTKEYAITDFRSEEDEPDFLVPSHLEAGEMVPIRWREDLQPVGGDEGETFVIGLPPKLRDAFRSYVHRSGMMDVARSILYEEKPLQPKQHRLYTLDDGRKWGAMVQGSWETDMVWLDPADEECFESLLGVLRRGGFDTVLAKLGEAFDLKGLMIQGVGAIFLSQYEVSDNMHIDIPNSKGSFYNVIIPVHIPANDVAKLYVGEDRDVTGAINLDPNVAVVLGGDSYHGTGECDYTEQQDFRLSFAIYLADINEENVELISSDSTSLWPTIGDVEWFRSQQGRLWSRDDSPANLTNDKGRKPLGVQDLDSDCEASEHLCETDLLGKRLRCPRTCRLYMEDDDYYSRLTTELLQVPEERNEAEVNLDSPTCEDSSSTSLLSSGEGKGQAIQVS